MKNKLKKISLDGWKKSGSGGNSDSYYNEKNDKIMLKLAKNWVRQKNEMLSEMDIVDKVMKLKISTPKMIEKVICDDRIGIIYERIKNKKSIGRLCHDNPKKIKYYAKIYAREAAKLHSIKCTQKGIPSFKKELIKKLKKSKRGDSNLKKKLYYLIDKYIKDEKTCLHCDMTFGNLVLSGNKTYWIDLGRFSYGDPIVDILDAYFVYKVLSKLIFVQHIFHLNYKQITEFLDAFLDEYVKIKKLDKNELIKKMDLLSIVWYHKMWMLAHAKGLLINFVKYKADKYEKKILEKYRA